MQKIATINLFMQYLKFSAAHFTIFSETERERLHGHNYFVKCSITAPVGDNGMIGDYRVFKKRLVNIVDALDEYTIIAGLSPYLKINDDGEHYAITFNHQTLWLPKADVLVLPIRNTTIEELSTHLLDSIVKDVCVSEQQLQKIEIQIESGSGQSCSACWIKS